MDDYEDEAGNVVGCCFCIVLFGGVVVAAFVLAAILEWSA